jgi:hypothetical protein
MKRTIYLLTMLAVGAAQAKDAAFYKELRYRVNDPFLFCTRGMDIPDPCWIPIAPYTGQYTLTGLCDPPTEDMRPWTFQDHDALDQLVDICPHAGQSGGWDNKAGDAATTPFKH